VVDNSGTPVSKATILVKGTNVGTSTDETGSFSLSAPAGATSQSRFAGGIHFKDAIENGQTLGRAMGKAGLKKLGLSN